MISKSRELNADLAQKNEAIRVLICGIVIGKKLAYITKSCRAEQSIGDGVKQYVRIRVPEKPLLVRDLDTAKDEPSALGQPVDVISVTYSDHSASAP